MVKSFEGNGTMLRERATQDLGVRQQFILFIGFVA